MMTISTRFFAVLLTILMISTVSTYAWPCKDGNGNVKSFSRDVSGFDKVIVKGKGTLIVKQGKEFTCEIKIDENLIDYIETRVNNRTLIIEPKKDICPDTYDIHVQMPEVKALGVKGSGDIISYGKIKSDDLRVRVDGSGDIKMDVDTRMLGLQINGSGDMDIRGNAEKVRAEINGSGDIAMFDCRSEDFEIVVNGSGDAEIHATERINVLIRGSGDVIYKGNPQDLQAGIHGSGEFKKIKGS